MFYPVHELCILNELGGVFYKYRLRWSSFLINIVLFRCSVLLLILCLLFKKSNIESTVEILSHKCGFTYFSFYFLIGSLQLVHTSF